nr:MAG TPA: hypothetical protein [Caudoviricetes sp.]
MFFYCRAINLSLYSVKEMGDGNLPFFSKPFN